jgi:hypothetical protein
MTTTPLSSAVPLADPRRAILGLSAWAAIALALAASGVLSVERRFLIPPLILGSVAALVVLYARAPSLRALADGVDLRVPILFHVIRAPIGASFLVLMADGLDADFARIAGYGDILSGSLAVVAAAFAHDRARRWVVRGWNALALADILLVVLTAQRILVLSDHPESMALLTRFPMAMIPLFIVPLVIATHLLVFRRTARGRA